MRQAPSCQYLRFWGKQGYKSNITTSLFPKLYSLKSIKQNIKFIKILDWNRILKVVTVFLSAFIQFQIFDFNPIALRIRFSPFLFGNGRWVNVKLEKMATGSLSSGIVISPRGEGGLRGGGLSKWDGTLWLDQLFVCSSPVQNFDLQALFLELSSLFVLIIIWRRNQEFSILEETTDELGRVQVHFKSKQMMVCLLPETRYLCQLLKQGWRLWSF